MTLTNERNQTVNCYIKHAKNDSYLKLAERFFLLRNVGPNFDGGLVVFVSSELQSE